MSLGIMRESGEPTLLEASLANQLDMANRRIGELKKTYELLNKENSNIRDGIKQCQHVLGLSIDEIGILKRKLTIAIEALEYYANEDLICNKPTRVIFDKAKEALEKISK